MMPQLSIDVSSYLRPSSAWCGIYSYVQSHADRYPALPQGFSEDELLKAMKKNARQVLPAREYDTFRKAITSLQKGTAVSIKQENLFRLLFVLNLPSDTAAQDLLMNYMHQSELSCRNLDEFIVIAALKLQLSWVETDDLRMKYEKEIAAQPLSPEEIAEGQTAEVYYSVLCEKINDVPSLCAYLDVPDNLTFFSRTCNTRYLALFDDVQLETLYNSSSEASVIMYTDYGCLERETMLDYYHALYRLPEEEIRILTEIFENVFMSYDNFCLLVQRKRPVNVSSGLFLLGLFKKLLTEEEDIAEDFYVDFLDSDEFTDVLNDILIYFGFPVLNPGLDPFERLVLDVYHGCLDLYSDRSNHEFQQIFIDQLWNTLGQMAHQHIAAVIIL